MSANTVAPAFVNRVVGPEPCQINGFMRILDAMLGHFAIRRRSLHRAPWWLALLAMAIQFVASYGHLHSPAFGALLQGHGVPALVAPNDTGSGLGDRLAPDTDCPICASIAMLGSSALPDGVQLPLPSRHASMVLAAFAALHLTSPPHLLFETRGPPLT